MNSDATAAPVSAGASGWRWLPLAAAIILLDQLAKLWVLREFHGSERIELLPVLDFTLMYNTGAAFSFLAGASGWQRWFFLIVAVAVAAAITVWLRRLRARARARRRARQRHRPGAHRESGGLHPRALE